MENMCRLCFNVVENEIIQFFSDESERLDIKNIIVKHFWFSEIRNDDNLPKGICLKCWKHLNEFHDFYQAIEIIHTNRSLNDIQWKSNMDISNDCMVTNDGINFVNVDDDVAIAFNIKSEVTDVFDVKSNLVDCPIDVTGFLQVKLENTERNSIERLTEVKNNEPLLSKEEVLQLNAKSGRIVKKTVSLKKKKSGKKVIGNQRHRKKESYQDEYFSDNNNTYDNDDNVDCKDGIIKNFNKSLANKLEMKEQRLDEDARIREFYNLSCTICFVALQTFTDLRLHYRSVHNVKTGYVSCCNRKLVRRGRALEHMNWHRNPTAFTCEICNKAFTNKRGLKTHTALHIKPEDREFHCDLCGDTFTMRANFMRHFRIKHIVDGTEFRCEQCDKSYKNKTVLQSHIRHIHRHKELQICHICAKVFKSKSQYKIHYMEHIEGEKPRIQCQICGTLLKNESNLKSHLRRSHNSLPITCTLCGKIVANKNSYRNHMRNMHTNVQEYKCVLCEKIFKRSLALKEHMATHSGKSILYSCAYCLITFNSNANLCKHRKNKHHEEWLVERSKRYATVNNSTI